MPPFHALLLARGDARRRVPAGYALLHEVLVGYVAAASEGARAALIAAEDGDDAAPASCAIGSVSRVPP